MGTSEDDCRVDSGRRIRWTDLSVLILSLLLAASVATVIYMSVKAPATTCSTATVNQPQTAEKSMEINVEVEVNGKKTPEKIAYNGDRNNMIIYDENGGFSAEDFDKGWIVTNLARSGECVVIPTGDSRNRTSVASIMRGYANSGVIHGRNTKQDKLYAQILPGHIDDKSMFPDEVNELCRGGYRWLTTVDLGSDSTFQVGDRKKRAIIEGCYCAIRVRYSFIDSFGDLETYYYNICLPWCYSTVCSMWESCDRDPNARIWDF